VKLRVLIVDDEPLAREKLRTLLQKEPDVEIAGECRDGAEAVTAIARITPDLVFLDVQMPEVDGFGVLEALPPRALPAVIFVTAYDRYALKAFEVHALDYLLKPFDRARFQKALFRARAELERDRRGGALDQRLRALLKDLNQKRPYAQRLVIREAGRVFFLRVEELDWIEAAGNYARLHAGGDTHLMRETMKALETRLDPDRFVRIHRAAIVNLDRVKELRPGFRGEYVVVLKGGREIISSRSQSERIRALLKSAR
jgi:two-component system LytT family response regulator